EDAGVAGEVDGRPVLEAQHEPGSLAEIVAIVGRARVEGVHDRELDAACLDGAALVGTGHLPDVCALLAEPAFELDEGHDLGLELLAQLDGLADVVAVAVGERDHVDPLGLLLGVRALRVAEPRIDVDALASGRVQPEARVAQPRHRYVGHSRSFLTGGVSVTKEAWRGRRTITAWLGEFRSRSSSRPRRRTGQACTGSRSTRCWRRCRR